MADDSVFATLRRLFGARVSVGITLLAVFAVAVLGFYGQQRALDQRLVGEDKSLDIKNLIRQVKKELGEAEAEAIRNNELALFKLEQFEMEINYVIRSSGGLKAEVVSVGGRSEVDTEKVQKLRLRWSAVPPIAAVVPPGLPSGVVDVQVDPPTEAASGGRQ